MKILYYFKFSRTYPTNGSVAKKVNANYDQMNYSKIQQSGYEKLWETHSSGDITKPKSFS